jgi:hypothetical protein
MAAPAVGATAKPPVASSSGAPATLEGAPIPLVELRNQGKCVNDIPSIEAFASNAGGAHDRFLLAGRAELLEILQAARGRKALVLDTALRGLLGYIVPEVGKSDRVKENRSTPRRLLLCLVVRTREEERH